MPTFFVREGPEIYNPITESTTRMQQTNRGKTRFDNEVGEWIYNLLCITA